jgi:hypothetical protein
VAAKVSSPQTTRISAGATGEPVSRINVVATSGAVPLNVVKPRLNASATPLKRMRVGKRSVRSVA